MTRELEEQRFVRELAWTWTISRLKRETLFSRNVNLFLFMSSDIRKKINFN